MEYREELIKLVQMWTEDNIDITDNWSEWETFLTEQGYIKTYDEVYEMDLSYLQSQQDMNYWAYGKWDVDALINDDNDITKMSNGCYFVHNQSYIDESDIDLFYEQQEAKAKQERLNYAITQAYKDLDKSFNAFSRFDALLFVFGHDFGSAKINFLSDINKVKEESLKCIQDVLNLMNKSIDDGFIKLWLPNHNIYSNEEDEKYCELIRFGGYSILEDGQKILNADAIILKDEESIQTLEYYTYENMNQLCDYIAELFEFYKEDVFNVGNKKYEQAINKKLNKIIDQYWKDGKIDFDYAEFYKNH